VVLSEHRPSQCGGRVRGCARMSTALWVRASPLIGAWQQQQSRADLRLADKPHACRRSSSYPPAAMSVRVDNKPPYCWSGGRSNSSSSSAGTSLANGCVFFAVSLGGGGRRKPGLRFGGLYLRILHNLPHRHLIHNNREDPLSPPARSRGARTPTVVARTLTAAAQTPPRRARCPRA